jgi:acyl-CoA thioester hydrolase
MHIHETRLRVRYAETDQMGVVYYANYLTWMEVGRVEYCKSVGFSYKDMEMNDGLLLAVVEAQCRYLSPARFDEEIAVRTWVDEAGTRIVRFGYEMREAETDRRIATGHTRHVVCGPDFRPARLPARYRKIFGISS